jgi:negative regulator of flagellin synthesis FlgM
MRINDAYRQTDVAATAVPARPPTTDAASGGTASSQATAPVTVSVSSKALELASQTSDASAAKVASLQSSIANGTFKIDPQAIAQRIVGDE